MKDGQLDPTVQDPIIAAFGFGRRIWSVALHRPFEMIDFDELHIQSWPPFSPREHMDYARICLGDL